MPNLFESKEESQKRFIDKLYESFPLLNEKEIPKSFFKDNIRVLTNHHINEEFNYNEGSLLKNNDVFLFNFCWSNEFDFISYKCKNFLTASYNDLVLTNFLNKITHFENIFNFEIPLDFDDYSFYIDDNTIIPVLSISLCDPYNEHDDGIGIIITKDSNEDKINKKTEEFFNYIYKTHFKSIHIINNNTNFSELNPEMINIIKLLVY